MSAYDIGISRQCAAFLRKKGWHGHSFMRRGSTQIQQIAFTTSLIVSYSRPFKSGRGSIAFPARLLDYGIEEKSLHNRILNLRDKVHAHTDDDSYEIKAYDDPYIKSVDQIPYTHFSTDEIDKFLAMTLKTVRKIQDRMEEIHSSARTKNRK